MCEAGLPQSADTLCISRGFSPEPESCCSHGGFSFFGDSFRKMAVKYLTFKNNQCVIASIIHIL